MARNIEIHSTEKLLQLIRHSDSPKPVISNSAKTRKILTQPLNRTRRRTIGVDIGHTYIKMAKVERLSDNHYELTDYLDIPLQRSISLQDPALPELLKQNLDRIGGHGGCEIWSAIPSSNVETRYIRIPKLPRRQIRNAVLWTFTQKVAVNQQDDLFDYEVLGDITEGGVRKTEVMAVKAPRAEIGALKSAFEKAGYPLKGITISSFAIQNLFRRQVIPYCDQEVCSLFVGRDWSRIAIFRSGNLVLSRGIKAGMHSMFEAIQLTLRSKNDWQTTMAVGQSATPVDQKTESSLLQEAQGRFFELIAAATGEARNTASATGPTETFHMILPALERLVRQVERTLEHYALTFPGEGIRRLLIAGQLTASPAIVNYLSQQLELPTGVMNPFESGTFSRQIKVPRSGCERESFAPSIGLAISNNSLTPNFLYTHENKDRFENIRRNNMRILTTCILCLMVLIGFFSWQERQLDHRRTDLENLNQQLLTYNPMADQKILLAMFAKAQQNRQTTHMIVRRYSPVAAMQELSAITPAGIRLISTEMSRPPETKAVAPSYILTLEGIIFGNPGELETTLTSYLFVLNNSPLFRKSAVQSKRIEFYNAQEVLRFTAKLEMP